MSDSCHWTESTDCTNSLHSPAALVSEAEPASAIRREQLEQNLRHCQLTYKSRAKALRETKYSSAGSLEEPKVCVDAIAVRRWVFGCPGNTKSGKLNQDRLETIATRIM